MSTKKSKLADLLVRVRYSNPLPAPPFPPKLLQIPTDPARYARLEFTAALANETALPMVVDAECGMPLDLSHWECLWADTGDDSALNPDPENLPLLDPEDALLLDDSSLTPYTNGHSNGVGSTPATPGAHTPHVAWLRKTEYISRATSQRIAAESKIIVDAPIDVSVAAQIRDIEASFPSSQEPIDLSTLKHPNKPHLTAVDSYDILPDADTWANEYDLFKFSERPGERPLDVEDLRLDCAILRPMESDGDHFLAYYLTKEDLAAEEFKQRRRNKLIPENNVEEAPAIFHFVRDYEVVKIEQDVPNEFLLVLDDGNESYPSGDRPKGAYYKNIERKIMLKKKRVNKHEVVAYTDKWDVINLQHVPFGAEDKAERDEMSALVSDPTFISRMLEAEGITKTALGR